jgi:hypothetical protein
MLADAWVRLGLHPLSIAVITNALRRYSDAGAQFVLNVTTGASEHLRRPVAPPRMTRLLTVGVDTFRHATLTSLHARRLTAIALAQAGAIDEVLEQLTAIANIQAARRESGLSLRKGDQNLLRQVKRPTADADIDFQVYTMQEAVRAMPVRQMSRERTHRAGEPAGAARHAKRRLDRRRRRRHADRAGGGQVCRRCGGVDPG